MDLLSISRAIWRHKLAMLPIVLITLAGLYYVMEIKPPVYQSTAEVLLTNPKIITSTNPAVNDNPYADNPFANLGSLQEVADVVINKVTSPSVSQGLIDAGASPNYEVALSADVGGPPIIIVTGVGSSSASATNCAALVASAVESQLYGLQSADGVNAKNMINAYEYVKPQTAKVTVSPKLRELIAVLAIGALLMLVVVSVADVVDRRRKDREQLASDQLAELDRQLDRRRGLRGQLSHSEPQPALSSARWLDDDEQEGPRRPRSDDGEPVIASADTTEFAAIEPESESAGRQRNGKASLREGEPARSRGAR
jgi:capsular polysaccharide biosynthesis protein